MNLIDTITGLFFYFCTGFLLAYIYLYTQAKFTADLQARIGPALSGSYGILQPIVDYLKLLQKQKKHNTYPGYLFFYSMILYTSLCGLPLGSLFLLCNMQQAALFFLLNAFILGIGFVLLGLREPHFLGKMKSVYYLSQLFAGVFPAFLSLLTMNIHLGADQWQDIADAQGFWPLLWGCFSSPIAFLSMIIFYCSGQTILFAAPFDAAFLETEGFGSIATSLSGKYLLFFLSARFYTWFFWCITTVVIFFGAWKIPPSVSNLLISFELEKLTAILEFSVLLIKTWLFMLIMAWVRESMPRLKMVQISDFSWKILAPLSILCLASSVIGKFIKVMIWGIK